MIVPILSTLLVSSCDDPPDQSRDVYQSQQECLADWNEGGLCEQMNDDDASQYANGPHGVYYYGPRYYPSDRTVIYRERVIAPAGRSTTLRPMIITSRSSSASRGGVSSPRSTSTGGFGGRSIGGSGSRGGGIGG
jgi:hypothetical protein